MIRRLIKGMLWLGALGGVLYLGLVAVLHLAPRDRLLADAVSQISQRTGRAVTIADASNVRYWPVPGVDIGPFTLANAAGFAPAQMIIAQRASVTLAPLALLTGEVRVGTLTLEDSIVHLSRDAGGVANWTPGTETGALPLSGLTLRNASIRWRDEQAGRVLDLDAVDGHLTFDGVQAPLSASATGRWNGRTLSLDLTFGALADLAGGARAPLDLTLSTGSDRLDFTGYAQRIDGLERPIIDGRLTARSARPADLITALSLPYATGALDGLADLSISAEIIANARRARLNAVADGDYNGHPVSISGLLRGGENWTSGGLFDIDWTLRAGGLVSLTLDGKVSPDTGIEARLSANLLAPQKLLDAFAIRTVPIVKVPRFANLKADLSAQADRYALSGGVLTADQSRWGISAVYQDKDDRDQASLMLETTEPLRFASDARQVLADLRAALTALSDQGADIAVSLAAPSLSLGTLETGVVALSLRTQGDALTGEAGRIDLFGGTIAGALQTRLQGTDPLGLEIRFAEVDIAAMDLSPLASGIGAGTLSLTIPSGRGGTLEGITGTGQIEIFGGSLDGLGLEDLVRGEQANALSSTALLSAAASLSFGGGRLVLDDAALNGTRTQLRASGAVDLSTGAVDILVTPEPRSSTPLYRVQLSGPGTGMTAEIMRDRPVGPASPASPASPTPAPEPAPTDDTAASADGIVQAPPQQASTPSPGTAVLLRAPPPLPAPRPN